MNLHIVLAALIALGAATARCADAHAILVESSPAINAAVPAGALALRLRYNSRIDAARSRLTLIAADGASRTLTLDPDLPPDILAAHAELAPGAWRLRWQVLAVDGHITRGDVAFTLTGP